jgi:hypothetical protein
MSTGASFPASRLLACPARLLLALWLLALVGCGGDGATRICFGSDEFCSGVFGANRPPLADAGADQEVISGARVLLDGAASRDPDGHITAYAWTQEDGPVVALEQAGTAVARFDAPVVSTVTVLTFRLLVTDNRGASAVDRVQVTVQPRRAGALARGLALLKEDVRPAALAGAEGTGDAAFAGLWLGARVEAAVAEYDDEIDRLLDELRVVMLTAPDDGGVGRAGTPAAQALVSLGEQAVAAFTVERDPATAALAGGDLAPAEPVQPRIWAAAIAAAFPQLAGGDATLGVLQQASERLLLGDLTVVPDAWLAAATLLLALPPPVDGLN